MRFLVVDVNKEFHDLFIKEFLNKQGYEEVYGQTGGDDDYICVDTLNKQWCYCENGFYPFCSQDEMMKYQFKDKSLRLNDLIKMRR